MLVATWILAIATALLAVSGPVALFAWLSARKQDRERRQREREDEMKDSILKGAKDEFVSKSTLDGSLFLGAIGVLVAIGMWTDRRH